LPPQRRRNPASQQQQQQQQQQHERRICLYFYLHFIFLYILLGGGGSVSLFSAAISSDQIGASLTKRFYLVDHVMISQQILEEKKHVKRKKLKNIERQPLLQPLNSEHSSKFNVCTLAVP